MSHPRLVSWCYLFQSFGMIGICQSSIVTMACDYGLNRCNFAICWINTLLGVMYSLGSSGNIGNDCVGNNINPSNIVNIGILCGELTFMQVYGSVTWTDCIGFCSICCLCFELSTTLISFQLCEIIATLSLSKQTFSVVGRSLSSSCVSDSIVFVLFNLICETLECDQIYIASLNLCKAIGSRVLRKSQVAFNCLLIFEGFAAAHLEEGRLRNGGT